MHFCWMLNEWTVMSLLEFSGLKTEGLNKVETLLLLPWVQSWGSQWVRWAGSLPLLDFLSSFRIDGMVETWFGNDVSFTFCSGTIIILEADPPHTQPLFFKKKNYTSFRRSYLLTGLSKAAGPFWGIMSAFSRGGALGCVIGEPAICKDHHIMILQLLDYLCV